MKYMFMTIIAALGLIACGQRNTKAAPIAEASIQEAVLTDEGAISWDTMLYDFGDVSVDDGPLTCTFTLTNGSDHPVAIYEVVSSCGCTGVTWSRESIQPGKSATISATYKNEDGPGAFDKTLTVYISGVRKPVILRLRGIVHEKKKSLSQLYGVERLGDLGLKTLEYKLPTLKQGLQTSESITVANLGKKPIKIEFADVSPQLTVKVDPNPVPAQKTAKVTFTLSADPALYGGNKYTATPVVNGRKAGKSIVISSFTQENFSLLTPEERDAAAIPMFASSTFDFGIVKKGKVIEGEFTLDNRGKRPLYFFKADVEDAALAPVLPGDIGPGEKGKLTFRLDTSALPDGENVIMLTLTTNSPLRPVVNLFVAGIIQ